MNGQQNIKSTNSCFIISLLYASKYFEHHVLIIRRSKLYYAASGVITTVDGLQVQMLREDSCARDGHLQSVMIPDAV